MKKLIVLFFFVNLSIVFADAGPKFVDRIYLEFYSNGELVTDINSMMVIVENNNHKDTAGLAGYTSAQYHTGATLHKPDKRYMIRNNGYFDSFTFVINKDHKEIKSERIMYYPGCTLYKFDISNGVSDISPLLYVEWDEYFISLLKTIVMELLVGLLFFRKYRNPDFRYPKFIITFILLNIASHFSLWYLHSHLPIPIVPLELAIMAAEAVYWKFLIRIATGKAIKVSILTNLASWWLIEVIIFSAKIIIGML